MNKALNTIYAAMRAPLYRRAAARSLAVLCSLGCAGAALAGPNDGNQRKDEPRVPAARDTARIERAPLERPMPAPRQDARADAQARPEPRPAENRFFEGRADEQRRLQSLQQDQANQRADAFKRNGRLTADERRDLRRQINEAGQDIYANTPRR